MKRILLTGKDGQVGWELQRTLAPLGKVWSYDRKGLDLSNADALVTVIRELKPDLIVNAAAYTAVDKAEKDQDSAYAINGIAPGIMAEEAKRCDAVLIHYSTDYVFNGISKKPYLENDAVSPLNVYGKSKLQGEQAIQTVSGKHLILRTSWVYGMRGKNFLLTILRLGKEKEFLKIVGDQFGAPTWSRLIAGTTAQMAFHALNLSKDNQWGIYHLTASGQTSWFNFAEEIFKAYCKFHTNGHEIVTPKLQAISTFEYPLPAVRPQFSVLSNEKLLKNFQLKMPDWNESLYLCMDNLK
jgi:dTDP-4-dehydrorhamnose reductase